MKNRFFAALQDPFNLLGFAGVATLSAALLDWRVMVAGLLVEAAYLVWAPRSRWLDARMNNRVDEELRANREQLKRETWSQLRPSLQKRFEQLETQRALLETSLSAPGMTWMQEVREKLDFLLDKFLEFALKEAQLRAHLEASRVEMGAPREVQSRSGSSIQNNLGVNVRSDTSQAAPEPKRPIEETIARLQEAYAREWESLQTDLQSQTDESTKTILQKRLDVLARRREFASSSAQTIVNLTQQLQLIEESFGLIADELLTRAPEQLLGEIEDVVSQTQFMSRVLKDLSASERMIAEI